MAELSTIARPYAEGLMAALQDHQASPEKLTLALDLVVALANAVADPQVTLVANDPKVTQEQLMSLFGGVVDFHQLDEVRGLLEVVIENGRLEALPEIARQFRILKNEAEGVADALIETAFPMTDAEVTDLVNALSKKFPNVKLRPNVVVDQSLIGGVRVHVGDKVLDTSVRQRLEQMKTTLIA